MKKTYFAIGLMSGTSMDGIDAALIETDGEFQVIEHQQHSISYDHDFHILLKAAEYSVNLHQGNIAQANLYFTENLIQFLQRELQIHDTQSYIQKFADFLKVDHQINLVDIQNKSAEYHINAVAMLLKKTNINKNNIDVIGYHGQTLYHQPKQKCSIQIGDGQLLAKKINCTVVNNFRNNDIQHGGEGAPFAPIYHHALAARDHLFPCVVVNCGGIANISVIIDHDVNHIIGFDTGPGNVLIDRFVRFKTNGQENMDRDGNYGKNGKINQLILEKLYTAGLTEQQKDYFQRKPPKSLDSNHLTLFPELMGLSIEDGCATLAAFTAQTIVESIYLIDITPPTLWALTGNGWKNLAIKEQLKLCLQKNLKHEFQMKSVDEIGWNSQTMEAQLFAYLAVRRLKNLPISFPNTTRAPRPLIGGEIFVP